MTKVDQIIQSISEKIKHGELREGDKISSVRTISAQYQCSKETVQKALRELRYQNLLYAIPQSGHYVLWSEKEADTSPEELLDFGNSMPDASLFPYDDFRFCLDQATRQRHSRLFTYFLNPRGLPETIEAMSSSMRERHLYAEKERVVVTTGVQQALYILSQMAFPNGKQIVLLEQPTYHLMNKLVRELGIKHAVVSRTEKGLDFEALECHFKTESIKFFYTIPRFHNPLGTAFAANEKKLLAKLARKYDVYVVEDDYLADFDLNLSGAPLYYYDSGDRVIYLKSFSKIIFPGLRIGCAVLPGKIKDAFIKQKVLIDYATSPFVQKALAIYISSNMFSKHAALVSSRYRQKALLFWKASHFLNQSTSISPSKTLDTKRTFMLRERENTANLAALLKQNNMAVDFLENNFLSSHYPPSLKIDVCNIPQARISAALQKLFSIIGDSIFALAKY